MIFIKNNNFQIDILKRNMKKPVFKNTGFLLLIIHIMVTSFVKSKFKFAREESIIIKIFS
ncbi:hypothetical protein ACQKGA_25035 [Priestia megaterium]|uniref:hypothetical protein n=1 Tax=Priestia megaterium TaxID=1404 RepID=UPI003D02B1A2